LDSECGRDIDFEAISAAEDSNEFQKKPGFGKEKSVEDVVTLGPMAQATLVSKLAAVCMA
jgi:hypothetical protein